MYLSLLRYRKRASFDVEAYARDTAWLEALASQQPGFIALRRYRGPEGEILSVFEWESEDHAKRWSSNPEHAAIQARARRDYLESYVDYSCAEPEVRRWDNSRQPATFNIVRRVQEGQGDRWRAR